MPGRFGTFSLGRWGSPIAVTAAAWLVATIAILTIPEEFRRTSLVSLGVCVLGLVVWFAWVRNRIASGDAGISSVGPESYGSADDGEHE